MKLSGIVITHIDRRRLGTLIQRATRYGLADRSTLANLERALELAQAVDPSDCSPGIVSMNATIRMHDLDSGVDEVCTLVYPAEVDVETNGVSVLSPLGTALIGRRVGDVVRCSVGNLPRRIRIDAVLYQPEYAGAWDRSPATYGLL